MNDKRLKEDLKENNKKYGKSPLYQVIKVLLEGEKYEKIVKKLIQQQKI